MPPRKRFYLSSCALLLTACGGGGGGDSVAIGGGETVLNGQFMDSPVSGIRYVTETRSGITDRSGHFEYVEGETVTLFIGEQILGDAPGAALISLFDVVDGASPLVGTALEATLMKLQRYRYRYPAGYTPGYAYRAQRGPNFATVVNLARLLQTLDEDGDPDNGIEIPADVAALFAANSVDFNQHWEDFTHDRGVRKALSEAKSRGLLDGARQIRKPWRAMAHLYASLGIDSEVRAVTGRESADYGYLSTSDSTYDAEGKLIRLESDYDGDSYTDETTLFAYDDNGNVIRSEVQRSREAPGYSITYTYDADGNLTRSETVGETIENQLVVYRYDAYGDITRIDYDLGGNGAIDNSTIWTYQNDGYAFRREENGISYTYNFDANDNVLREEIDYFSDGVPDWISTYSYDVRGNEVRYEEDNRGDGSIDSRRTTSYDADDNVVRQLLEYESGASSDRSDTYRYDARGNPTRYEGDDDGDGVPERVHTTTYVYDNDGNWIRRELDLDGDAVVDNIGISTYDADGNEILREFDINGDGYGEITYTWRYAADTEGWWRLFESFR